MHFFLKLGLNLIKMRNLTLILATLIFVILCTVIAYLLEPDNFESLPNSFYFVMTTFSTVGYGDYSPVTAAGKTFAVIMYLVGIGLLGVVIGKIVDAFTIFRRKREEGKLKYGKDNHIIIVGWSKKTAAAVQELLESDDRVEVVVIDVLEKSPIDLAVDRVHYIQGDPTCEETFEKANISSAKSVVVFSDDNIQDHSLKDAKTLSIAITAERVAPDVHTTVEIMTEKNKTNFSHVNVDEFILSQQTISSLAVRSAMYKGVTKVYSQLMSRQYGEDLYKISKKENWHTYRDAFLDLLQQGATLIADRDKLDINRRLDEKIADDAVLYVVCNSETYQKLTS
ncbi:potassium channel family protein [Desertibacillus haloalkaliphilus]|uniref:potassium channel family protein n=1 Tax=Desertibacillus haloalkaliphilus TaxID=1328930 RepID=UPI001C26BBCC|nr:potassium channel family protein [Desertibacillus haloalkaliphilus]MBU8908947.1 NAD-binding protein [Desertibacillus haloalkaliphilus]